MKFLSEKHERICRKIKEDIVQFMHYRGISIERLANVLGMSDSTLQRELDPYSEYHPPLGLPEMLTDKPEPFRSLGRDIAEKIYTHYEPVPIELNGSITDEIQQMVIEIGRSLEHVQHPELQPVISLEGHFTKIIELSRRAFAEIEKGATR